MKNSIASVVFAIFFALAFNLDARAQNPDACGRYSAAITPNSVGGVPIVPDLLLTDWRTAVGCLAPILSGMRNMMKSESTQAETRAKFLSATGAIRKMANSISELEVANAKSASPNPSIDTIVKFNYEFQRVASIDTYATLVTGARSEDVDIRKSAISVLGNVMDEKYACIPLVQILDPKLRTTSYFVKARANLLGMLSRIAPFVYRDDFVNMGNVLRVITQTIQPEQTDDHSLDQTRQILENAQQRLDFQTRPPPPGAPQPNARVPLSRIYKDRCINYMAAYPATDEMKANIIYR